jgi:pimeloyl-ACP methyl ester carboxylesterase
MRTPLTWRLRLPFPGARALRTLALLALALAGSGGAVRAATYDPLIEAPPHDPEHPAAIEEVAFEIDGSRMGGLVYVASGPGPHPTFVLLHGYPGNEKNLDLAQILRRAGFDVVFFHYRGAWGSEGAYAITHLEDDVAAVLAALREPERAAALRVDPDRLSLLGHSMGGFAALAAGRNDGALRCVGAMAPANPALIAAALGGGEAPDPRGAGFLRYADSLFMLAGHDGASARRELLAAPRESIDTRTFGPALVGRSVWLVNGDRDTSTPVASTFAPVVDAYAAVEGLRLRNHVISGDHSFSWSRTDLARLLLAWALEDCR